MKKTVALVLSAIMCLTLFAGCGKETPSSTPAASQGSEAPTTTKAPSADKLTLKLDSGFTAGTVLAEIPQEIIKRVTEASNGTIEIQDFPQDALGTSPERAPMLMAGELDISVHALSVFDQYNPKQTILNAFFMFTRPARKRISIRVSFLILKKLSMPPWYLTCTLADATCSPRSRLNPWKALRV